MVYHVSYIHQNQPLFGRRFIAHFVACLLYAIQYCCKYMHISSIYQYPLKCFIIRPFDKWTYYALVMSVCPSIRVFRFFFQHVLRYQFETCYLHLVGGTTCRVSVSSHLGHFDLVCSQKYIEPILQWWPHKSRLNLQILYIGMFLDVSSVYCKNRIFEILAIMFVPFGFFDVFRAFYLCVLRFQLVCTSSR